MKEQIITFETSKLAKEKGFDIPIVQFYTSCKNHYLTKAADYQTEKYAESNWNNGQGSYPTDAKDVSCSAPTQSLLQKWLREKHNIHIDIHAGHYAWNNKNSYLRSVYKIIDKHTPNKYVSYRVKEVEIYEEALEKGLQEGLKLIK